MEENFDPSILFRETGLKTQNEGQRSAHSIQLKEAMNNLALQAEYVEFVKTLHIALAMDEGNKTERKIKREVIKRLQEFWVHLRKKSLHVVSKPLQSVSDKLN